MLVEGPILGGERGFLASSNHCSQWDRPGSLSGSAERADQAVNPDSLRTYPPGRGWKYDARKSAIRLVVGIRISRRPLAGGENVTEHVRFTYRAFLSYSHRDKAWADWLHGALEAYRIDDHLVGRETPAGVVPKTLAPIFRDRADFAAGHSLTEQTLAALSTSQFLIVICSPHAARSEYVNEEIRRFKDMGRAARVIAIIVDGEPGDPQRECFPPALRFKLGADGALTDEREEPIAADARRSADGKRLALQKVVAGLLGVPFDDVRKRDAIAASFRMTVVAAGVAVFAVIAMAAGYFVWHAGEQGRREATLLEEQKRRDGEQKKRDDEHRNQLAAMEDRYRSLAEKLLGISSAQAASGQAQAVSAAVAATVQGAADGDGRLTHALALLEEKKIDEAAALLRAVAEDKERAAKSSGAEAAAAYRHLGAIAGLGDPKRARDAYGRAVALDPEDREALYWHGWLQLLASNLAIAETDLSRLLQASLRVGDERGVYRAYLRLGQLFVERENLADARERIERAHEIAERNAGRNPDNLEWQRDLSVSHNTLGSVWLAQGSLTEALKSYQADLAIADRLAKYDPSNAGWQRDLSVSHDNVGDVQEAQGNLPEALKSHQMSFAIRDRLAKADPGKPGWQHDLSDSYQRIGDVHAAQGNLPEALKSYRASLAIVEPLAKSDPGNVQWQVDVLWSHWRLAIRGDDASRRWPLIVEALRKLKAEDKLTAEQAKWLPEAERRLAEIQKK
jgi:eukaryotic-like serine/threonine-protein kinase